MAGRPPKPLELKRRDGDTRKIGAQKHEARLAAAFNAPRGRPDFPASLKARKTDTLQTRVLLRQAKAHWEFLADQLGAAGMLAELDEGMLTAAALLYANMAEAGRQGKDRELTQLVQRYMQLGDRMGLSESARSKLPKAKTAEDDMELALCG